MISKRRAIRIGLVVVLAGVFSAKALGADIYVSRSTGKNSNPGSKDEPKKLLWRVIGKLSPGDHVYVAEGMCPGKGKSGLMPKFAVSNVTIEGGWKADFSERDPFRYLTIISAPADRQGQTGSVFHVESPDTKVTNVTIDGFCIDRGQANYYYGDGEPGANKSVAGHKKDSCWGYQFINKKMSGSDPAVCLIGRGNFTVRNMLLVNCPWWGIYVKGGGDDAITIENNLILISQGRGIEAITGSGWGKPKFVIRNNTVAFNHALAATEGRALSIDPRKSGGTYKIAKNVLAFSDGSGVAVKFAPKDDDVLELEDNLFFFNRRGDFGIGGKGLANAGDFEDELECEAEDNVRKLPGFLAKMDKAWFDRYSMREAVDMLAGNFNSAKDLEAARAALGLKEYHIPGYDKTFAGYKDLPAKRNNYNMSRYPHPMKEGKAMDWKTAVIPLIGADGKLGIRPAAKK